MNLKEIKEVIQLMNENGLSEIEIEKDGLKIRMRKGAGGYLESSVVQVSSGAPTTRPEPVPVLAASPGKAPIKSPMVGTFYAAPAPDAAPFVQPGSTVEVGQVICIIEAMKLMNEIKAEVRGKVTEILVHSGDPVEFGQPLFVIE